MHKTSSGNIPIFAHIADTVANSSSDVPSVTRESSRRSSRGSARIGSVTVTEFSNLDGQPVSAFRERVEIGSLLDTRLRMRRSVTLEMERGDDFYVAKCAELNEYGYGTDPTWAIEDARRAIAELYWELKENQDRLGADLAKTWQRLSELVYEA